MTKPLKATIILSPFLKPSDSTQIFGKFTKYEPLCFCSFLLTLYSVGIFYASGKSIGNPICQNIGDLNGESRQKMSQFNHHDEQAIDEFLRSYERCQGGIFTQKTRVRILTKKGISGRGREKAQFWYRQRENVKTALLDIELFIEKAGEANVNRVITNRSLDPIVRALFLHPQLDKAKPDWVRAKIAQLLIKWAFDYLQTLSGTYTTKSHQRTIEEAIDLSNHLTSQIILKSVSVTQP